MIKNKLITFLILLNLIFNIFTIDKHFVIIIPSYNNKYWLQRNLDSVFMQSYENYDVIYVDDASPDKTGLLVANYINEREKEHKVKLIQNQTREGCPLANQYKAIHMCKPDDIIVLLDGDDWFANDDVLKHLNTVYQDPNVWVTYGQFVYYPAHVAGWAMPVPLEIINKNAFRQYSWYTTHLKTFYAELFQKIKKEDLLCNGKFFPMSGDLALMFPIIEMAGHHIKFIPELLYIYNTASDLNEDKVNKQLQDHYCIEARNKKPYQPLEKLDFQTPIVILSPRNFDKVGSEVKGSKKIYIKPWAGKIFDVNDPIYNRDDCLRAYYETQQTLKTLGYDLIQIDSFNNLKDAHLIVAFDLPQDDLQYLSQYSKEKLILYLLEPITVRPDNYDKKNHDIFSKIYTWCDDLVDNKKYFKFHYPVFKPMISDAVDFENKKLCTMILSNKFSNQSSEIYSERKKIIKFFEENHINDFDFYGMHWNKNEFKTYKGYANSKVEIIKNYRFCISFENSRSLNGYVTEKLFDCFRSGTIPVYIGAPNVGQYVPKNCFIDAEKFMSHEELYQFLKNMTKEQYETYLKNIKEFLASENAKLFSSENFIKIFKQACEIK